MPPVFGSQAARELHGLFVPGTSRPGRWAFRPCWSWSRCSSPGGRAESRSRDAGRDHARAEHARDRPRGVAWQSSSRPWLAAGVSAAQEHVTTPGTPRRASDAERRVAAPGADRCRERRRDASWSPPACTTAIWSSTSRFTLHGQRPARSCAARAAAASSESAADDVTVEGFEIDGRGGGDLGRDSSGIHVTGAARRRPRQRRSVTRCSASTFARRTARASNGPSITGIRGKVPRREGIRHPRVEHRRFRAHRQRHHVTCATGSTSSRRRTASFRDNTARDLRYGLHYMFSDDNVFEDNRFENGAAGAALMYSRRLTFRRNRFVRNRGFASVGLLLKTLRGRAPPTDNLIADNARGLFVEGVDPQRVRRATSSRSPTSRWCCTTRTPACRFEGNAFIANLSPLQLVGRRTDTVVTGNYWSDHRPARSRRRRYRRARRTACRTSSITFAAISPAADLFAQGLAARSLGVAERTFPMLDLVAVVDDRPLARPAAVARRAGLPPPLQTARSIGGLGDVRRRTDAWVVADGPRGRRGRVLPMIAFDAFHETIRQRTTPCAI